MEWSATATAGQAAQVLGGRKARGGEDHGQPPPPPHHPGSAWGLPSGQPKLRHPLGPVPGGKEPSFMIGLCDFGPDMPPPRASVTSCVKENNHSFPRRWKQDLERE